MARANRFEKFRKLLLEEREQVTAQIARINRRLSAVNASEEAGEMSDYDNHPGDQGTETFERTKDLALDENLTRHLESINNALRKIDDGTYGTCNRCGGEIHTQRLNALPYATFCVNCQDIVESR